MSKKKKRGNKKINKRRSYKRGLLNKRKLLNERKELYIKKAKKRSGKKLLAKETKANNAIFADILDKLSEVKIT